MRNISLLTILILITFSTHAEVRVTTSDRVKNFISVKDAPATGTNIIGKLLKDQTAAYISEESHYFKIRLDNSIEGYVHKSWSKKLNDDTGELEIHFINSGQGDSTLIICPNYKTILIDAGSLSGYTADTIRDYILPVIDKNERKIDYLFITHPDTDHYNLIQDSLKNIPVGHTFFVGDHDDYGNGMNAWLISQQNKTNIPPTYFDPEGQKNPTVDCGNASVFILAANVQSSFSHKNTMSIVLMIKHGDFEVVLTGDATKKTEEKILSRYSPSWLNSDVLKIGHHGSSYTSTTDDWAKVIKPEVSVVSAGIRSQHGHPRKEIIKILEPFTKNNADSHSISYSSGIRGNYVWEDIDGYVEQIYSTVNSGNVIIRSDGSGYTVDTVHHVE